MNMNVDSFLPPVLLNSYYGLKKNLRERLIKLLTGKSFLKLRYELLEKEIKQNPEISKLYPPKSILEHYGYISVRDSEEHPDLFLNQLRYYRMYSYFKRSYPDIFDKKTKILNIGDTSGIMLSSLTRKGLSLNIKQESVDSIKAKGMEAVLGDVENLQFGDSSFDYIFCFQTLEHLYNPLKALSEIGRVVKKRAFISIPMTSKTEIRGKEYWAKLLESEWDGSVEHDDCHIIEFNSKDFINYISYVGLECVENFPIHYFENTKKNSTYAERLIINNTGSYYNFFVLKPKSR